MKGDMPSLSGKRVVLGPGEYFASEKEIVISTLLGSCVAACLWDKQNRIIGMNHFLLAHRRYAKSEPLCRTEAGKYGIHSMELLINGMMKLGARRENLRAKAFGGASVMNTGRRDNFLCVGEVNCRFIVEFLKTDGIPLVASDLGGDVGRVIHFFSDDFAVYSRKMGKIRQEKIVLEEKGFWKRSTKEEKDVAEPEIWL
jgi:chemotaxis protein CheD